MKGEGRKNSRLQKPKKEYLVHVGPEMKLLRQPTEQERGFNLAPQRVFLRIRIKDITS